MFSTLPLSVQELYSAAGGRGALLKKQEQEALSFVEWRDGCLEVDATAVWSHNQEKKYTDRVVRRGEGSSRRRKKGGNKFIVQRIDRSKNINKVDVYMDSQLVSYGPHACMGDFLTLDRTQCSGRVGRR